MKKFTNVEVAKINLANLALGLDKEVFEKAGLDPNATYRLNEFESAERSHYFEGKTFSGKFLMETGIDATLGRQFASRVIRLKKV